MEITEIKTQKVLSPTQISLADYVINPYRGCEFNCLYCYSYENKNVTRDSKILGIKINAPLCLEKELRYKTPRRVLLGSTTECFQYQETHFKITEQILKLLNKNNIPYTILTKSHLIKQYLPLIAGNQKNKIYFTLNCASDKIIRLFEEKSPLLKERLLTIEEIIKNNISLRIHMGPFIPYISDFEQIIKILPAGITEIDVEIYHHKMGNFNEIIHKAKENISQDYAKKLKELYIREENYKNYGKSLKEKIKNLCMKTKKEYKIYFIQPDYNEYYKSSINYEETLF
jgi:DNA repair photolyase